MNGVPRALARSTTGTIPTETQPRQGTAFAPSEITRVIASICPASSPCEESPPTIRRTCASLAASTAPLLQIRTQPWIGCRLCDVSDGERRVGEGQAREEPRQKLLIAARLRKARANSSYSPPAGPALRHFLAASLPAVQDACRSSYRPEQSGDNGPPSEETIRLSCTTCSAQIPISALEITNPARDARQPRVAQGRRRASACA